MFQPVQPGSIYAGGSQTKCMGKTALTVKAGVAYGHQSDICGAGDAKCFCQCIHGTPYPPGTGPTGEKHHACTADQGSFFGKRSLGDGLAVPGAYVVVPGDFHMITFNRNI